MFEEMDKTFTRLTGAVIAFAVLYFGGRILWAVITGQLPLTPAK